VLKSRSPYYFSPKTHSEKSFHPRCFGWNVANVTSNSSDQDQNSRSSNATTTTTTTTTTGQPYYVNPFARRIVSAHAADTKGLHCPYCSTNCAEEFIVDIPINRGPHGGRVDVAAQEFVARKLNLGSALSSHQSNDDDDDSIFVVGILSGSNTALEDRLRLFDRIMHVAVPPRGVSRPPPDGILRRLQFIYHETSLPSIRLVVRRWQQDSCPFEEWTVVPHDHYGDAVGQFLQMVHRFVQASTPPNQVAEATAATTTTPPTSPGCNLAALGFHPVCFDGEMSFDESANAGSPPPQDKLERHQVANLMCVAIEHVNLQLATRQAQATWIYE
jgi:hypothetical protein